MDTNSEDYIKSTRKSIVYVANWKKKEADVGTHRSDLRSLPGVFQAGHRYVLCTIYASGHPPTPSELRERSFFRHDASKTLLNPRFGAPNPQICFRKISKIIKKMIFRFLLFFGSMMSKDSPRPLKAFKSVKMCPIQLFFEVNMDLTNPSSQK